MKIVFTLGITLKPILKFKISGKNSNTREAKANRN